jgi:toxin ParE1/3/4
MARRKWRVRLGAQAELDFANILRWTAANFGASQARLYGETLVQTIHELADGPNVTGTKARDDIMRGVCTLHVARHGRRGRHLLLYRVAGTRIIEIARILHDSMDLRRHLPVSSEDDEA